VALRRFCAIQMAVIIIIIITFILQFEKEIQLSYFYNWNTDMLGIKYRQKTHVCPSAVVHPCVRPRIVSLLICMYVCCWTSVILSVHCWTSVRPSIRPAGRCPLTHRVTNLKLSCSILTTFSLEPKQVIDQKCVHAAFGVPGFVPQRN